MPVPPSSHPQTGRRRRATTLSSTCLPPTLRSDLRRSCLLAARETLAAESEGCKQARRGQGYPVAGMPSRLRIAVAAPLAALALTPVSSSGAAESPLPSSFPAPPAGAVVYSREDVSDDLALGVVRRGSGLLLQASVLDDEGNGAKG